MFLKEKISKKKRFFILLIFVLIFTGLASFFYFWQHRQIKGSPDDYIIVETEDGIIVKNERAGLIMRAPNGWTARKIDVMEGSVVFYSPDAQGLNPGKIKPPLQKGCIIEAAMAYRKTNFENLKKELEETRNGLTIKKDEIEEIKINGKPALKNNFDSLELGPSIEIYMMGNFLYGLAMTMASQDFDNCSQYFDSFLKEVSIE